MGKNMYFGVNGVARKVKYGYFGVNGVARKVKYGYVGINAVAHQFFSGSVPLEELAVGTSVYMNVNGVSTEFIAIHQGLPSSLYDSSCNGTWLLMKDAYEKRQWEMSGVNNYASSGIHTYLNNTFLGLFDSKIQSTIKQVKIPYRPGNNGTTVNSGSNGLSTRVFLLSFYECGWTTSNASYFPVDGACLSYFSNSAETDSKRIAYYNGSACKWWLRSPRTTATNYVAYVNYSGKFSNYSCSDSSTGVRPALILPSDTLVDENFNIIA